MTYPVLIANKAYALVEIRIGKKPKSWKNLTPLYTGSCTLGQKWTAGEGQRLSVKHCMWPDDPHSTLSLAYTVDGEMGIQEGQGILLRFPSL